MAKSTRSVPIFQQPNAALGRTPRRRTVGIVEHLHDEHPPVLVEGHGDRALHIRLGRHKFDFQALRQNELALRFRRRKWARDFATRGIGSPRKPLTNATWCDQEPGGHDGNRGRSHDLPHARSSVCFDSIIAISIATA